MNYQSSVVDELSELMSVQLSGKELAESDARRLSDLLSEDPQLVRLAVEMAVAHEACQRALAKLAF